MTISFNNITPLLAAETERLKKKAPNETGIHCWLDDDHQVTVAMKRVLNNHDVPRDVRSSAYKAVKDTATVTITPPNEELSNIIAKYFLSVKTPAMMGSPERLFFDVVIINDKSVIG